MKKISLHTHLILVCVVVGAALLFRIDRADVIGDSATYLYRAVGLIDFLSSKIQTTPLQWLSEVPWWVRLQFHDAPPLALWIMHAALALSGGAVVAARATAAGMFLIFSAIGWWWIARRSGSKLHAWIWIALLGTSTALLALARTNLLESYQLLWLGGSLIAFFETKNSPRAWYVVALCAGAALITKYTAVFVFLGPSVWCVWHARSLWKIKEFKKSLLVLGVFLLLPLTYNVAMWRTIGHPDLPTSQALGINTAKHWSAIKRTFSPLSAENARDAAALFFPSAWLMVCGAWLIVFRSTRTDRAAFALAISLCATVIQMALLGADARFSAGFLLVSAVAAAYACATYTPTPHARRIIIPVVALCVLGGLTATAKNLYAFTEPTGVWRVIGREPNVGYQQLDKIVTPFLATRRPRAADDVSGFQNKTGALHTEYRRVQHAPAPRATPYRGVIIYDARLSWFSSLWYFERWNLYNGFANLSTLDFANMERREPHYFAARGFDPSEYSFVLAVNQPRTEFVGAISLDELAAQTVAFFEQQNAPTRTVYGPDGVARFKIFGPLALEAAASAQLSK